MDDGCTNSVKYLDTVSLKSCLNVIVIFLRYKRHICLVQTTYILKNQHVLTVRVLFFSNLFRQTVPMRDKEGKQDYRFMPEPNLPPLILYDSNTINKASHNSSIVNIDEVRGQLPELPEAKRRRLVVDYGIRLDSAVKLVVRVSV